MTVPREFDEIQCRVMRTIAHIVSLMDERQRYACKLAHKRTNDKVLAAVSAEAISTQDDSFLDFCLKTVGRSFRIDNASVYWYDRQSRDFYSHMARWRADSLITTSRERYTNLVSIPVVREVVENRKPFFYARMSVPFQMKRPRRF